jgi:hypothetical protein
VATLCWSGFGGAPVLAAEFASGAGYSLTHDTNITRVPNDPVAEWTQSLIGGFFYQERTVDLKARIAAEVERRDYIKNSFGDENAFFVNGAAVWTISPQQFNWTVEDVAHQVRVDITRADTPSNRVNSNALSTGPDFTFRMSSTNSAAIGARYGRFDIRGPGDNVRYSAYARFLHRVAAPTTVSLNYQPERVYFQEPAQYAKVSREELFIRYDTRFSSVNSMTIDLGATRITPEGAKDQTGGLARLSVTRQITPGSALAASLAEEYSETSSDLLKGVTGTTGPTGAGSAPATDVVTSDTYYSKRGDLTYNNQDGFFGYSVRGYARRVDFQQLPQDSEERGGRFTLTWLFSGETQIRAYTDYVKRVLQNSVNGSGGGGPFPVNETDRERTTSVGVNHRLTRNVNASVEGVRIGRASTAPSNTFVDWRVILFLGYSTGPFYTVQPRR